MLKEGMPSEGWGSVGAGLLGVAGGTLYDKISNRPKKRRRDDRGRPPAMPYRRQPPKRQNPGVDSIIGMGTRDMIRGPHYSKKIGSYKGINVANQLNQLVDDTKVFKQQFKLKIESGDGLRQWAQIVCRYRAAPGKPTGGSGNPNTDVFKIHGETLNPNQISNVTAPVNYYGPTGFNALPTQGKFRLSCPPMIEGRFEGADEDMVLNSTYHTDDPNYGGSLMQNNLFFLNMPLTYLEQDMYNMGMGPGVRRFTRAMYAPDAELVHGATGGTTSGSTLVTTLQPDTFGGELQTTTVTATNHTDRSRNTPMKPVTHPAYKVLTFPMENPPMNNTLIGAPQMDLPMKYDFRWGWGINQLDYNLIDGAATQDTPSTKDPQWLKTNNSECTIATIADGEASFTFNNLGETQAYVTTLVVVQKHVDKHYYSMPTALTDTYLKCAQQFIQSGEWSITNNITEQYAQQSKGEIPDPYMYLSHPSIKPFGKVPTKFLEDFNKYYVIKSQSTIKLGIGERQSCKIDLGGLQYSATQLAMNKSLTDRNEPKENQFYHPVAKATGDEAGVANLSQGVRSEFPFCCQQGTTHFLFGVQGFSTPYVKKVPATGTQPADPLDIRTCQGRWAVPALIDISGTYKEIIKPLTTSKQNVKPMQKCLTALPLTNLVEGDGNYYDQVYPIATAMPRIRTSQGGAMELSSL